MSLVSLDQKKKTITINKAEIDNKIIFQYFDNIPSKDREEKFFRALYIGVLAQMEDRLSSFLSKTQNELGTELESLKMIFEMKKEIFYTSTIKGMIAEEELVEYLNKYFKEHNLDDVASASGTLAGEIEGNKTGDIICLVNKDEEKRIVIESKFDKSIKLGDIADKDVFTKNKYDTAWSQIIEAKANRGAKVGMIIFDKALVDNSILKFTDSVAYIQSIGFIAIVDSQSGDYSNLIIAYNLARDIILNAKDTNFDEKTLNIILKRIIKDIEDFFNIKRLVESNINNNQEILKQLEKSLLQMEFSQEYLEKFLQDGNLNNQDLLDFYNGEKIKDKYNDIEESLLQDFE